MFIRTKTSPRTSNIAVQVVESFRVNGKVKQRVLRHLGTAPPGEALEQLKVMANALLNEHSAQALRHKRRARLSATLSKRCRSTDKEQVTISQLEETRRTIVGIHDVYGHVYEQFNFNSLFSSRHAKAAQVLRDIVLMRMAHPQSKRASVADLAANFGVQIPLEQVYRMMDKLDEACCQAIQQRTLSQVLQLTGGPLQVLFYDATTLYFESFTEDELKQNGYSKDQKMNQPQVLFCLLVTTQGLPVGYEVFPGATFEGKTLHQALKHLEARYQVKQLVVVADRGMLNEEALYYLQSQGYFYVVGAKLRSLPRADQQAILDWSAGLDKEAIQGEATHRQEVVRHQECAVKVRQLPWAADYQPSFSKPTYVLIRQPSEWRAYFYVGSQCVSDEPATSINGLQELLEGVPGECIKQTRRAYVKQLHEVVKAHHACHYPRQLIISYRPARAFKDQHDRVRTVQRLQQRLKRSRNPKHWLAQSSIQKFVTLRGEACLGMDEDKLAHEAQWDGLWGVYTNCRDLSDFTVLEQYRGLWQVEESFRVNKHDLRIRPIYHWTPHRVQAHLAIAFMAFSCVRYLEYRLSVQSEKLSPRRIQQALMSVQVSELNDNGNQQQYRLYSQPTREAHTIYRVLGLTCPHGLVNVSNTLTC